MPKPTGAPSAPTAPLPSGVVNVPNALTLARLILSIAVFVLIPYKQYGAALVIFIIAASTDWIDGYYARKYGQVTKFGRIFDPFVDKIIICGTFIFLAGEYEHGSGIWPWMAVVVVGRELLVTALRSAIEGKGGDFSAKYLAKWKMVLQCVAVGVSFIVLRELQQHQAGAPLQPWMHYTLMGTVWAAIGLTVWTGLDYVAQAARVLRD